MNNTPFRRVGTITTGVALVIAGALMLTYMFFPKFDYTLALKLSPLIIIGLGVETLFAARTGSNVKYDWVGILLCFLIVSAGLGLFCWAWWLLYHPM